MLETGHARCRLPHIAYFGRGLAVSEIPRH